MSIKRIKSANTTVLYFIISVVIILAFILLGGGTWIKVMMHGSSSMSIGYWSWTQIMISLVIGFLLGLLVARRK
jgi:TRAP-type C4-dicarboxylate transport system permease small subunit